MNRRGVLHNMAAVMAAVTGAVRAQQASATEFPALVRQKRSLTVHSTTDTLVFAPVVRDFQRLQPDTTVHYEELDAGQLYTRFLSDTSSGKKGADLLLSSAMDLQVKLVNDGFAAPHDSMHTSALPVWARWREEAFGFTFEPAVMIFNRAAMRGRTLPRSRSELLAMLDNDRKFWRGRVGTYDIARSSVGYLLASQDARLSSEFSALLESFGTINLQTEQRTAALLDRISSGNLTMGYNLLGSYARTRIDAGAPLEIAYLDDYTLAVTRTAVIPARAAQPECAHQFLEYLLSPQGQSTLAARSHLPAVRRDLAESADPLGVGDVRKGLLRPIGLGPGLLVYLDRQKRSRLLAAWRNALQSANVIEVVRS